MFAGNVQIDEDVVKQGAASLTRFTEALELLSEGNSIEATALMGAANSVIEIGRLVQYLRTAVAGCSEAMGASVAFVRGCVKWVWVRKVFAPVQHFASRPTWRPWPWSDLLIIGRTVQHLLQALQQDEDGDAVLIALLDTMRSLPVMLKAAGQAELPAALTACKQHPSAGVRQAAHAFMLALNLLPARPAVQPAQVLGVPARAHVAATGAACGALKQEGQEALELDWAKLPPEAVRCSAEMRRPHLAPVPVCRRCKMFHVYIS
jgi:hypothetical protein